MAIFHRGKNFRYPFLSDQVARHGQERRTLRASGAEGAKRDRRAWVRIQADRLRRGISIEAIGCLGVGKR